MNMISTLRQRIRQNGKAEITAEEYDQLQTEWITRAGAEEMVAAEREACAKACETYAADRNSFDEQQAAYHLASVMRTRSNAIELTGSPLAASPATGGSDVE